MARAYFSGSALKPELKMRSDAWRFQAFGDHEVLKGAAKRAAKADVIIVAGNSAVEPPDYVKSWIEPDPSVRFIMLQSAPLLVPYRPNASLKAKVL